MPRKLFNIVATLSLIMGAAVYLAWLCTTLRTTRYEFYHYGDSRLVNFGWSSNGISVLTATYPRGQIPVDQFSSQAPEFMPRGYGRGIRTRFHEPGYCWNCFKSDSYPMGIRIFRFSIDQLYGRNGLAVEVPYRLVATPLAIAPAVWLLGFVRRHRRTSSGRCPACGYDLRATPERCPECGASRSKPPHNPPMQRTATASSGVVE